MLVGRTLYYGPVDANGVDILDLQLPFDSPFTITAFVLDESVPGHILLDFYRAEEPGTGGYQSSKVPVGSVTFNSNHPARFTVESHGQGWGLYYGKVRYVPPPSISQPVTVIITVVGEGTKDAKPVGGGSGIVGITTNHVGRFTYDGSGLTAERVRAFAAYVLLDEPLTEDATFTVYEELPNTGLLAWGWYIIQSIRDHPEAHYVPVASASLPAGEIAGRVAVHDAYGLGYRFALSSADDSTSVESLFMVSAVPL